MNALDVRIEALDPMRVASVARDWVQKNGYRWRRTHELERIHDPLAPETEVMFDLYLPIEN